MASRIKWLSCILKQLHKKKDFRCHKNGRMPQLGALFLPKQVLIGGKNGILIMFLSHERDLSYFPVLMSNVRKTKPLVDKERDRVAW